MRIKGISTTQIAKICGVSQGTVDRALNGRKGISPQTREKVLNVAREYGYRPNIHARSIAGGKSQLIGVVVFDLKNQYFSDILQKIEACCVSKGYSAVVMFTDKDHKKEIECIKSLYHMAVDGIALCPINQGEEYENFLCSLNIPIVTFGNRLDRLPYVGIDNTSAVQDAVKEIIKKGYTSLIYVKPSLLEKNTFAQTERLNAFREICDAHQIPYTVTDLSHAEEFAKTLDRCAFLCPTDIYAMRLLSAAKQLQAGIIGFDNLRIIDELGLKLDSVAYNTESAAQAIVDHIISGTAISGSIHHSIVLRGSL